MMTVIVVMDEWTIAFWIVINNFNTFLFEDFFSSDIFRVERFGFPEIFFQTFCQPDWNDETEKHKNTPKANEKHGNEIHSPKELVKRPKR